MPTSRTADRRGRDLPGVQGKVPASALLISLLALAVAGTGAVLWPESMAELSGLVWLLAVVPSFLLAYHRGWQGAALGLAAGMALLIAIEIIPQLLDGSPVNWSVAGTLTAVMIAVSLGAGATADALRRRYGGTLELAYTDPLTGLPNRRMLDFFLARHFGGAQRGSHLSVVLFDLDGFKRLNDRLGHQAGDDALRRFARLLQQTARAMDVAGRYGGEEFLAVLPDTPESGARLFADRVCRDLEAEGGPRGERLTVSAGVASYHSHMERLTDLLAAADRALYEAKAEGGNRAALAAAGPAARN